MKSTLLQVGKQQELFELLHHLLYGCNTTISVMISVNQDVIQVHNDEDVMLFCKDLIDISLEACWYIL